MSKLIRTSLSEQIYIQLRNKIISHDYPSGKKLTVKELQEEFNVSNTPIREALTRLNQEGLVEFKTNQGAKVITLTNKDIIEISGLCLLHDCYAIRLAMENTNPREALEIALSQALQSEEKNVDSHKTSYNWEDSFHAVFYNFANNSRLLKLGKQYGRFFLFIAKYQTEEEKLDNLKHHKSILSVIKTGDIDAVIKEMEKHYEDSNSTLLNHKSRKNSEQK